MDQNEPLRVLIVEDESLLAMMVEDIVTDEGWTVTANVASIPEALEAAQHGCFHVALLDVNLAGKEVFPVADAVLARGLPLVFATGYGVNGIRQDLRHLPVIAKPFRPGELLDSLRGAVANRAQAMPVPDGLPA